MKLLHRVGRYVFVFIVVYLILLSSLIASATIPRSAIKDHFQQSAEYLCERTTAFRLIEFRRASTIDRFADTILLSVAYHLNDGDPLDSSMWARYYGEYSNYANKYLLESIVDDKPADKQYLRYWHGSVIPVRIMHLFWNIRSIYIFHAVLMLALVAGLLLQLWRHGFTAEAVCVLISFILVDIWYVPLSLEYTWMFLVMLVACNIVVFCMVSGKMKDFGTFFLVVGMVSAFLDFLTTETLTLLLPLLLIVRIQSRQHSNVKLWRLSKQSCALWLIGFCGMWAMKWATASLVLHENVMAYVTEHIGMRMGGGNVGLTRVGYIREAVLQNIRSFAFYEYGLFGAVTFFLLLFWFVFRAVYLNRVKLRKGICWSQVMLYFCLALIPYIRYMVLHNHSYLHSFTYRAQAASIVALCFAVMEIVEKRYSKRHTVPMSLKAG